MLKSNPYPDNVLAAKRLQGDNAADNFIAGVFANTENKKALYEWLGTLSHNTQLLHLPTLFANEPVLTTAATLPHWANTRMMQRGSVFFIRHSETIMNLLGLLSLPYCYTAANGAMVLYLSDRMRSDTTKRLYETAAFVWEVMAPDAFASTGEGFASILKVRLMHAAVRFYTYKSGRWNDEWGTPVNQEDMVGTNLSFSLLVMRGLRKLGITVGKEDQEGFMHLWNVIGALSGLDEYLLPGSVKEAQILDTIISKRQFSSSAHGEELTSSLTKHITGVNNTGASANDILGLMRYLLGAPVADMLKIDAPELPSYKIQLLKLTNLVKGLKPVGNTNLAYKEAYSRFKQQSPAEALT
ncbi:DUF2236 domain-containing protein [Mucilaginibacter terrenus]|uniref:DUF2236 domain-containing protein n=1 Tax=Mucilaginibacter terrenus TaxID=2482727 RepID=A0A3E2NT93_9SPHI|nr:oxygenase MpaB family protein [Mucilaginibacter terrenus]RFZ84233.1 DUF2236 domain-containing protein [Mucilaginibacter terrenus]